MKMSVVYFEIFKASNMYCFHSLMVRASDVVRSVTKWLNAFLTWETINSR